MQALRETRRVSRVAHTNCAVRSRLYPCCGLVRGGLAAGPQAAAGHLPLARTPPCPDRQSGLVWQQVATFRKLTRMTEAAQKTDEEAAKVSSAEVHKAGVEQLDRVEKALRGIAELNDPFTVRREGLHVYADLSKDIGSYWIQYSKELRMICLLSPKSGAYRYIYHKPSG